MEKLFFVGFNPYCHISHLFHKKCMNGPSPHVMKTMDFNPPFPSSVESTYFVC